MIINDFCERFTILRENDLPISEKFLLIMHNLCIVKPEIAKSGEEIAKSIHMVVDSVLRLLSIHEENGYVKSFQDNSGARRFYLTSVGILKVCTIYT